MHLLLKGAAILVARQSIEISVQLWHCRCLARKSIASCVASCIGMAFKLRSSTLQLSQCIFRWRCDVLTGKNQQWLQFEKKYEGAYGRLENVAEETEMGDH